MSEKKKLILASISILLCQTTYMYYANARSVALPTILTELGGMEYYSLVIILGSLFMSIVLPFAGKLGDIFGRKRVYILGLLSFFAAICVCLFAFNLPMFVFGLITVGITYGFTFAQLMAVVTDVYEKSMQPKISSYIMVLTAAGSFLGPIIGGFCVDYLSWRAIFLIMLPLVAINILCGWFGIPDIAPVVSQKKVDYLGLGLFFAAVFPFLFVLTSAGKLFPWASVITIVLLGIAVVGFVLLMMVEKKAANPIIPMKLFKVPVFRLLVTAVLMNALCYAGQNYLPVFYQQVWGMSSTLSGLVIAPRQIASVILALVVGAYLSKTPNYKLVILLPAVLFGIALALFFGYTAATPIVVICIAELIFGAAYGAGNVGPNSLGQYYLSPEEVGVGMAFAGFAGTLGNAVGAGLIGCIMNMIPDTGKSITISLGSLTIAAVILIVSSMRFRWEKAK